MRFSQIEKEDLFKAWFVLSLAFAILLNGGLSFKFDFLIKILFSGLTVGIAFLFHELAHKFVAQKYGCWAEFRADMRMLLLALFMSFFGFIIAAPGAVLIQGSVNRKQNGLISVAGPATNIVLGLLFVLIASFEYTFSVLWQYGYTINFFLATFNMLPFGLFDGRKVLAWDKTVYSLVLLVSIGLLFLAFFGF